MALSYLDNPVIPPIIDIIFNYQKTAAFSWRAPHRLVLSESSSSSSGPGTSMSVTGTSMFNSARSVESVGVGDTWCMFVESWLASTCQFVGVCTHEYAGDSASGKVANLCTCGGAGHSYGVETRTGLLVNGRKKKQRNKNAQTMTETVGDRDSVIEQFQVGDVITLAINDINSTLFSSLKEDAFESEIDEAQAQARFWLLTMHANDVIVAQLPLPKDKTYFAALQLGCNTRSEEKLKSFSKLSY